MTYAAIISRGIKSLPNLNAVANVGSADSTDLNLFVLYLTIKAAVERCLPEREGLPLCGGGYLPSFVLKRPSSILDDGSTPAKRLRSVVEGELLLLQRSSNRT
jgi:hypothetical protein